MNLLHSLNQYAHLTPDEIVKAINRPKWVQGRNITEELRQQWRDQPIQICFSATRGYRMAMGGYRMTFSLRSLHRDLMEYWFILETDYQEGVWPTV